MEGHKRFDTTSNAYDGGTARFTIAAAELDDQPLKGRAFEFRCTGLDGGGFRVKWIPDDDTDDELDTGVVTPEGQVSSLTRIGVRVLRVYLEGLGGGATPVLHVYHRVRGL